MCIEIAIVRKNDYFCKKRHMVRALLLFSFFGVFSSALNAQQRCDIGETKKAISAINPNFKAHMDALRGNLRANYLAQKQLHSGDRITMGSAPVPVIFHFVLDSAEFDSLGGTAGIVQRIDSQIVVLNRDYNAQNPDSTSIPSSWKSLYGNSGITFGIARLDPSNNVVAGYEIKIIDSAGFSQEDAYNPYVNSKHSATGGLDAWDNTRYLNVWCINFNDAPGLLGHTIPKSFTGAGAPGPADDDQGVTINYLSLGKRTLSTDNYPFGTRFDEGRTLTHEIGHMFEIWHVWGDDGSLCPWSVGGSDDGLSDTPPQAGSTSGNPAYTISGGTINDGCKDSATINVQPIGIACLSYLDYTDDAGMHLFTTQQAAAMDTALVGENIGLVSNPNLTAKVPTVAWTGDLNVIVSPNPSTGIFNIALDYSSDFLKTIAVYDVTGVLTAQYSVTNPTQTLYNLNMSGMSKGIYLLRCNFASGTTITRKLLLQ
jgi:Secretion system C-terminal sorting domain/Pregnancy-associated plasma protein-A